MRNLSHSAVKATTSELWTLWEDKLQTLHRGERIAFLTLYCVVTSVAVVGNLLTIYVVITRKQRLLFKACLLSLALSDLIYAASCGANYISKLIFDTSLLWYLGRYGCTVLPFLQTLSLLSGSMSLVSIALDRYMAVSNRRKAQWHPGALFCMTCIGVIWSVSAGISSPMFFSYEIIDVIVVPEVQTNFYFAQLCSVINDDKEQTLIYYSIIFTFVFLPLFVTFISFNAIIAREIYRRRKAPGAAHRRKRSKRQQDDSSSSSNAGASTTEDKTNSTSVRNNASATSGTQQQQPQQIFIVPVQQQTANNDRSNERQRRQMRMFRVILVLMCAFIAFRLPIWVFLLIKLNYLVERRLQFLINYSLSALGIMNSMANPFLYTFLSETMRCTAYARETCRKFCKWCRPRATAQGNYANNAATFAKNDVLNKRQRKGDNGGVYLGN